MNSAEEFLQETLNSEEYRIQLRARLIAGTAKPAELAIAQKMGLRGVVDQDDERARAQMRLMPVLERRFLTRLLRRLKGTDVSAPARPITNGNNNIIGLIFSEQEIRPADATEPAMTSEPTNITDGDLMPRRTP